MKKENLIREVILLEKGSASVTLSTVPQIRVSPWGLAVHVKTLLKIVVETQ